LDQVKAVSAQVLREMSGKARDHRAAGERRVEPIAVSEDIRDSAERIFLLIADLDGQDRWLAKSAGFRGTTDISPDPVTLGTVYRELGLFGTRQGRVMEYDPPSSIALLHPMPLSGGTSDITVRYTLAASAGQTKVTRTVEMKVLPLLLKPCRLLVVRAIKAESKRTLLALKAYCEQDPRQRYPGEIGAASWIDSIGGWATPLLGGFSLASVIAVSGNAGNSRWPGAAIVALTIAALILIVTVQAAQVARRALAQRADLPIWGSVHDRSPESGFVEEACRETDRALVAAKTWYKRARRLYHCGIIALLTGLALVLVPSKADTQAKLQLSASALAAFAVIAYVAWRIRQNLFPSVRREKSLAPWW
jgi:uncharacterized protein YndB with AHSA1/START domain